jgi:hypothetical protein
MRFPHLITVLLVMALAALAQPVGTVSPSPGKTSTGLSSLPPDAQGPISAALGKDDSGYWVRRSADGFRSENPRHALVAEFTKQGAKLRSHDLRWLLETRAYGYGDALHPVKAVAPRANANSVEYRRDGITELYENGPLGLEEGFTLAHPPGKANGHPLTVELRLRGLVASVDASGKALDLRGRDGKAALRYTGLTARDATGRELRSWLDLRGERLLVRVEDEGARYPVVVDPWVQQAELTPAANGSGLSVAVSGNTVVVGAPHQMVGSNSEQGAAYVFVESGGTWSQQAELIASDGATDDGFGGSVAVSGSTVVVGAPYHTVGSNPYQGVAYVFIESNGTWNQQTELTASNGAQGNLLGYSVAISGNTLVLGAPAVIASLFPSGPGAAYVFVESGGVWAQQAELTASDGMAADSFGLSVAVLGSTAVVGAPRHTVGSNSGQGAAYMFEQSGTTWSQQAELTASDGAQGDWFGYSVAVSGGTAVVGAPQHVYPSSGLGSAYVFVESGGTWSQRAELTASDGGGYFGSSVAVSGSTAVIGAPAHEVGTHNSQGAAYAFGESGGVWSEQAEITASNGGAGDEFGSSVAVSGGTAVVGVLNNLEAAYVFVQTTVSLSPASLRLGHQPINTTSSAATVTAKNDGDATLNISGIVPSANFAVSSTTCGATLAAGKTCKVSVTFKPVELGKVTGTVNFIDNAPNSPQMLWLYGTGVEPTTLTPDSVTYARQKVGTTSAAKTFPLTNTQSVELSSIAISTTGDFTVSATTCGTSLAAKSQCKISVVFEPTETGTRTGELKVSDSAGNSPQTSSLKGTGD